MRRQLGVPDPWPRQLHCQCRLSTHQECLIEHVQVQLDAAEAGEAGLASRVLQQDCGSTPTHTPPSLFLHARHFMRA